ncbi:hypothetical protein [Paraburkholderia sp.]|uniref:tetratricopeptide repeat protein n=1 Tax=Paraburkholderia sp. TaxID=1926495 RepID=UPI0023A09330|nr:hypothetical protein [Paraburkholderia sp.]MDE1184506.1 hypothetical protein [Paraburkholderia sp.]
MTPFNASALSGLDAFNEDEDVRAASSETMPMHDDTLELLISIGHTARVFRRFDEARYLFERLALLYPQRAFPYLGLGLVELDRANYRAAAQRFGHAVEVAPDSALARAWLGVCLVFDGHYARGARLLATAVDSDEPGAAPMAAAFLDLPECAPYRAAVNAANATNAANAANVVRAAVAFSTLKRLTLRGGH